MTSERIASKPHLILLDALRGVAALIVIWYHCYEGFATSIIDQGCNHGYLAVDFFFILSGFVIGYAYDDRMREGWVSTRGFFRRRLTRLHPMVVFGVVFGVICFLAGGGKNWAGDTVPIRYVMLAMLLNLFLLPVIPGTKADVRGNGEMFPLNGPHWSLFFEYIGNILYVLLLRKLPMKILASLTVVLGAVLTYMTISTGYLGIGWTLPDFLPGMVRMLFPYCAGMLLARCFMKRNEEGRAPLLPAFVRKHSFLICAALLLILLPMHFIGGEERLWINGLYVSFIILFVFPILIWTAAEGSGCTLSERQRKAAALLGDVSYPLYAIHYPVMYLVYQYIGFPDVDRTMAEVWPVVLSAAVFCIILAWLVMKFYDKPLRQHGMRLLKDR